jgi:predicted nucleic acid-binding Zn ribbon protein
VDGDISKSVEITGTVDANKPGTYTVTYNVSDQSGNHADAVLRTVTVVDKVAPVITLKGEQSVTIDAGENYEDAGATAHDAVDGDISKSIETTGAVDANRLGVYTIIYSVKDNSGNAAVAVVRTVRVVDKVAPVITLKGQQIITINAEENYKDAGATAHDDVDGDITQSIEITGLIIKGTPGVYTLTFNVKDKSGNAAASVVRTVRVTVVDEVAPVITLKGEQSITIDLGETYEDAGATAHDAVDGDITQSIEITGLIIKGTPGVYTLTFKVKDKSGNAAVPVVRTIQVVKPGPPALGIARNADGTLTITFEGELQTAPGVNASWQAVALESPAVLPAEKAAAFFRAKR